MPWVRSHAARLRPGSSWRARLGSCRAPERLLSLGSSRFGRVQRCGQGSASFEVECLKGCNQFSAGKGSDRPTSPQGTASDRSFPKYFFRSVLAMMWCFWSLEGSQICRSHPSMATCHRASRLRSAGHRTAVPLPHLASVTGVRSS